MIESSFLCPSSWDFEPLIDFLGSDEGSIFNDDRFRDELESERIHSLEFSDLSNSLEGDYAPGVSISFSNVYKCISDNNIDDLIPVTEPLISRILDDSTEFQQFDWSALLNDTETCNVPITDDSADLKTSSIMLKKSTRCKSSTLWSKMSPEEQLKTLHVLSEIVTCRMSIREQMEVIKIIDPSVEISPNDTEFALDSSSLNDRKMKKLRNFVQKHGFCLNNSKVSSSSASNVYLSEKSSLASKIFSRKASSRTKRRQKKQKMCTSKDVFQRSKLELHGQKEAQSGLFVYEKVIKKLSNPLEEEEDVNILE